MNDPVKIGARSAAERLKAEHGPHLPADVERALHSDETSVRPDRYFDPISLGGLIVSIASLAYTAYVDLKARTPNPSTDVIARTIRVKLDDISQVDIDQRDRIIAVTVEETVQALARRSDEPPSTTIM